MVCKIGMGYGIWESLAHLAGNRLSGHEKVWVMGVYGLSQVWIKTEATVTTHSPNFNLQNPQTSQWIDLNAMLITMLKSLRAVLFSWENTEKGVLCR